MRHLIAAFFLLLSAPITDTQKQPSAIETLACASPCAVNGNNKVLFNTRPLSGFAAKSRNYFSIRVTGTSDLFVCFHASVCTTATYDVFLASASKDSFTMQGPAIWSGGITVASAAATTAVAFGQPQ